VHGIERGGGWAIELQGMFLIAAVSVALLGAGGLSVGGLSVGGRYGRRN
jgi:putative oxidoreductase